MSKLSVFLLCILAAIGFWFYSKGACPLQALGRNSAAAAGENYQNITAAQLKARLDKGDMLTVIDVRTKEEYASGHVPGSILIPFDEIKAKAGQLPQDKNTEIVVYCRCGNRLIMLHNGRVIVDVEGEEKAHLTIPDLLKMFEQASGDMLDSDRLLLS